MPLAEYKNTRKPEAFNQTTATKNDCQKSKNNNKKTTLLSVKSFPKQDSVPSEMKLIWHHEDREK